jgi:tryptophanyl-tRNA synthetase
MKGELGRIRERREQLLAQPDAIDALLVEGARKARVIARETMARVRARLGISVGHVP